jgi:hypothetical protein
LYCAYFLQVCKAIPNLKKLWLNFAAKRNEIAAPLLVRLMRFVKGTAAALVSNKDSSLLCLC